MGIKGLWKEVEAYVQEAHLQQFRGLRVAIDMYVLLHSATLGCVVVNEEVLAAHFAAKQARAAAGAAATSNVALAPVTIEQVVTLCDRYIETMVDRIESLQRFGVIPVCVFDGADIPMKSETNVARQARREEKFHEAITKLEENYLHSGGGRRFERSARSYTEAVDTLASAVDISTEVAHPVIQVLREERHVECIVAPYEADPQLTYLVQSGYAHAALSIDSDLIAYYCPRIIKKVDYASGRCLVLSPPDSVPTFFRAMATTGSSANPSKTGGSGAATVSVPSTLGGTVGLGGHGRTVAPAASGPSGFTYESFLLGCVMSGCDYAANLSNIGIKKAFRLVARSQSLPELLACLREEYGFPVETVQAYRRTILRAFYCFMHHIVYCPTRKGLVHLHPFPAHIAGASKPKTELVGEVWSADVARRVCEECMLDPTTLQLYLGTYQPALQSYLSRTRRGQVPLTEFAAFRGRTSARVVVGPTASGSGKRGREGGAFSGDLQRVGSGKGFLGTGGGGGHRAAVGPRALVRSKYFLHTSGRQVVVEDWSASSDGSDGSGSTTATEATTHAGGDARSRESLSTHDPHPITLGEVRRGAPESLGQASPTPCELTPGAQSPSSPVAGDATSSSPSLPPPPPPACACPFGYPQCGTAHSIFVQCFAGKEWTRAGARAGVGVEAASSPSTATTAATPAGGEAAPTPRVDCESRECHVEKRRARAEAAHVPDAPLPTATYQCAGFRPPRPLGHASSASDGRSGDDAERKRSAAASLFDKLTFKRS